MTCGPFETERQARETPAVRAVYAAFDAAPGAGAMRPHNRRLIQDACQAAGVGLGAYDAQAVAWLAAWESQMCVVVAGLIRRAALNAAQLQAQLPTVLDALDDAAACRSARTGTICCDCDAELGGLCCDHAGDDLAAIRYGQLAGRLRREAGR